MVKRKNSNSAVNKKSSKSNRKHKTKLAVDVAKQYLESQVDATEANVEKLLKLSEKRIKKNSAENLLNRIVEKQEDSLKKPKTETEKPIFTDDDIKLFMAEYENLK